MYPHLVAGLHSLQITTPTLRRFPLVMDLLTPRRRVTQAPLAMAQACLSKIYQSIAPCSVDTWRMRLASPFLSAGQVDSWRRADALRRSQLRTPPHSTSLTLPTLRFLSHMFKTSNVARQTRVQKQKLSVLALHKDQPLNNIPGARDKLEGLSIQNFQLRGTQ